MNGVRFKAFVALLVSVSGSVWSGGGTDAEPPYIGVAAAMFDDNWASYLHQGIAVAAEELGARISMVDGRNDPVIQADQIKAFIAEGVDAVLIIPANQDRIGPILDDCEAAGIPVVAANRAPPEPEFSRLATYVGSDALSSGTMQAEAVAKLLEGRGDVAIMGGIAGHEAQINRTKGNRAVFERYPDIRIVAEGLADWDREKGFDLMEQWILDGRHVDAVVANNDEMAIGAIIAMDLYGTRDDVIVAGIDATPEALKYMEDGKLDVTVFQDAFGQGHGGLDAAIRAARGEDLPPYIEIPYELVLPPDRENYQARWE